MRKITGQEGSVLVASLVAIAVLLMLFMAAFSYGLARYSIHVKSQHHLRARFLAETGINRTLHSLDINQLSFSELQHDSMVISIESMGRIDISCRPYGTYLMLSSTGISGNRQVTAHAVIGREPGSIADNAITLTEATYPLTISGTTRITGDIATGPIQITTGQIDGQGVVYDTFHVGDHDMAAHAPEVNISTKFLDDYVSRIYRDIAPMARKISTSLVLAESDQRFLRDYPVIYVDGNLEINGLDFRVSATPVTLIVDGWVLIRGDSRLDGYLEIISGRHILIGDSAVLTGGICYAHDSLIIDGDAYFANQGFSSGKLAVRDRAEIQYPSVLLSTGQALEYDDPYALEIVSHRETSSLCLYIPEKSPDQPQGRPYVDTVSVIEGLLYSSGGTDLRGTVDGSIVTGHFHFEYPPTTYINWLRDVRIDRKRLSYLPTIPLIFDTDSRYRVFGVRYY